MSKYRVVLKEPTDGVTIGPIVKLTSWEAHRDLSRPLDRTDIAGWLIVNDEPHLVAYFHESTPIEGT